MSFVVRCSGGSIDVDIGLSKQELRNFKLTIDGRSVETGEAILVWTIYNVLVVCSGVTAVVGLFDYFLDFGKVAS